MARRKTQDTTDILIAAGFVPATETELQDRVIEQFVAHGAVVERVNSGRKGLGVAFVRWYARGEKAHTAGMSDLVVTLGRTVFVEVKMPGEQLSPDQKLFAERTREAGGTYYIVRTVDQAEEIARILQEDS